MLEQNLNIRVHGQSRGAQGSIQIDNESSVRRLGRGTEVDQPPPSHTIDTEGDPIPVDPSGELIQQRVVGVSPVTVEDISLTKVKK